MISYFDLLNKARERALLSKKPNTKVGAILVDLNNNILFEENNDYIHPLYDNFDLEKENNRSFYSEHAERRLIFLAVNSGFCDFHDKTLLVTHFPCCDCARAIILVGIKRIIVCSHSMNDDFLKKWGHNINVSKRMLEHNNVSVLFV